MVLFLLKSMIKEMTLISKLLTILILTEMYHVLHHTGFTFHNLFGLIGPVLSLRISVIAIVLSLKSSSHKDIGMTNFVKLSLNSIIGISLSLASIKVMRQGIS